MVSENFESKSLNIGILGQKGINFLILTNFDCTIFRRWWFQIWYLFSEILSPNPQILEHFGPKNINLLLIACTLFWRCWFQTWYSLYVVLSLPSTQVTQTNSISPFCNLFGKRFFVFSQKFQNIMASIVIFRRYLLQM